MAVNTAHDSVVREQPSLRRHSVMDIYTRTCMTATMEVEVVVVVVEEADTIYGDIIATSPLHLVHVVSVNICEAVCVCGGGGDALWFI